MYGRHNRFDYEKETERDPAYVGPDDRVEHQYRYSGRGGYPWPGYTGPYEYNYGPHRGRGPKGYVRSDERIADDASEKLAHDGNLDASDIEVHVRASEITLTGTVDSRYSKRLAEDICDSVLGVEDVHNQLKIRRKEALTDPHSPSAESKVGRAA